MAFFNSFLLNKWFEPNDNNSDRKKDNIWEQNKRVVFVIFYISMIYKV